MARRKDGRPRSNPELHKAMMELRKSNAASPHEDARTKRQRSRRTQLDKELETYDDD